MSSGGSTVSTSLIWFAITVTVQVVLAGSSPLGLSVIEEPGEPVTPSDCALLGAGHSIENELLLAVTDSLKLTTMFVSRATSVAPSAGEVVETLGALSCVANEKTKFAAGWSGGSPPSTSLMLAAIAVTVQFAVGRSESGSSVIVSVPEP